MRKRQWKFELKPEKKDGAAKLNEKKIIMRIR